MKIRRRPAFYSAAALIMGILSSYLLINNNLIFLLKIILIIEVLYYFYYTIFKLNKRKRAIYIWLAISLFVLGSFLYCYQEYKYLSRYSISKFSAIDSNKVLAEINFDLGDLESNKVYLKVYSINGRKFKYGDILVNSEELKAFKNGDIVSLDLKLQQIASALNPGAFSYREYLKRKEVYLQGWNPKNIRLISRNSSLKNVVIRVKELLLARINYLFNQDNAAFIKAILLGEKEYLSYEQEEMLRNAGASHLLAISGLHMGILILSFSLILFKICLKKRNALYLLSFFTMIYIILVGAAVSIIRAAVLALLFLWSDEFNREGDFLNIISLSLIINLLLDPLALFTVSLQLSYILVLALFYLTPLLSRFLPAFLAVSAAAQLASLAITAYYFNEYAFIALFTNLWVIPFITILLPLIFILLFLSFIIINLLSPFVLLAELGIEYLFKGLKLMTLIQGRSLVIAKPEFIIIVLYYIFLFILPFVFQERRIFINSKKFKIWQKTIPVVLVLIIISLFLRPIPANLEIDFLAVGQGDGIFIQFPGGENMLIDTGPPGSEGRNVEYSIISYLNYLGISSIDYLMISHFDADHAGGLSHLLQRKEIKNIMIPPYQQKTIFHDQLAAVKSNKSRIFFLTAGDLFKIADCSFKILNPEADKISKDRNENSIVFLLCHQKRKFLFTGDLSSEGEARIVNHFNLSKIDVLKVGHHGSKTSSGEILLNSVQPELAVICVGRNNFGHPSAEVIKRFQDKSINYLRTDRRGMIKVISDGENIHFNSFR
jgi:competence protein ComEC